MHESQMGTIVLAAAAAVAIGGAAIALTYRCCSDQVKEKRRKKESKGSKAENEAIHEEDSSVEAEEDRERVELFKSTRVSYSEDSSGKRPTARRAEDIKAPSARTVEEIKAKYGRATKKGAIDAAGVAAQARERLMERGEKLAAVNQKTEELQSEAENFSSLAEELAKKMKSRKWWQL